MGYTVLVSFFPTVSGCKSSVNPNQLLNNYFYVFSPKNRSFYNKDINLSLTQPNTCNKTSLVKTSVLLHLEFLRTWILSLMSRLMVHRLNAPRSSVLRSCLQYKQCIIPVNSLRTSTTHKPTSNLAHRYIRIEMMMVVAALEASAQ